VVEAKLSITRRRASFASTVIGQVSATQTFTITNGGGVPAAAQQGYHRSLWSDTGDFKVVAGSTNCTGTLAAAAPCSVAVTFNPTGPGLKSTSLSVSATPGGT